jgi:hypothetical protein
MAIFQRSKTKAVRKSLANMAWEYRYDRRPFLIGAAVLATGILGGFIYLRRRAYLLDQAESNRWLDMAEMEMRAYQQEPLSTPEKIQEGLATGS